MADKLEKALAEFQEQQMSLGKEMGIQVPAIVRSGKARVVAGDPARGVPV